MRFPAHHGGLYGILSNPVVGYVRLAELMVRHGVRVIQLRMKGEPPQKVLETALRVREVIPPGHLFIVNDLPEVALQSGADGVHIGQEDVSYEQARELLGAEAVIGISTHDPIQTRQACALGPDYIGVGPVFETPTKARPDPVIGLDGMVEMLRLATVPAVAIGGIHADNLGEVVRRGARDICVVRPLNNASEPEPVLIRLLDAIAVARGDG